METNKEEQKDGLQEQKDVLSEGKYLESLPSGKKATGFFKGVLVGALAAFLLVGVVAGGFKLLTGTSSDVVSDATLKKLSKIQRIVKEKFLYEEDEDAVQDGILKGYVDGLDDVYSAYYDKEETKALQESTSGEYYGVGAVLSEDATTGVVTIVEVYEDSPAEKAGLKAEDILYKVDDREVTGMDLTEVVSYIKGDEGTDVVLTVIRGDEEDEIDLTATRAKIEIHTVSYEMLEDKIGYIKVTEFDTVTSQQYTDALDDLESQGMERLIVDLRNNPGGNVSTVCDMLDRMLPEGLIVYTQDKDGNKNEATSDEENQFTKPMVVLMNGNSASASEIYAGAIQDYGLGKIVGTQSYGKGVVQQIFDLGDETSLKITIADYYTPKGRNINGQGISPDVEVEYQKDENDADADNQLEKAIEVVKSE